MGPKQTGAVLSRVQKRRRKKKGESVRPVNRTPTSPVQALLCMCMGMDGIHQHSDKKQIIILLTHIAGTPVKKKGQVVLVHGYV